MYTRSLARTHELKCRTEGQSIETSLLCMRVIVRLVCMLVDCKIDNILCLNTIASSIYSVHKDVKMKNSHTHI